MRHFILYLWVSVCLAAEEKSGEMKRNKRNEIGSILILCIFHLAYLSSYAHHGSIYNNIFVQSIWSLVSLEV